MRGVLFLPEKYCREKNTKSYFIILLTNCFLGKYHKIEMDPGNLMGNFSPASGQGYS